MQRGDLFVVRKPAILQRTAPFMAQSIVFIHGICVNAKSWQGWQAFFEAQGYSCYAPSYPFHDGAPAALRETISPQLGRLSLKQVVAYYADFIQQLPEKPILIGHSMGGLVSQKLVAMGLVSAAVCITSAPPLGILTLKPSFYRINLPVINPFRGHSAFSPSQKWFHDAVCNTLPRAISDQVYDELVVPESRNVPRGAVSLFVYINFGKPHSPLLFISAEKDQIIPPALPKRNFAAYRHADSIRAFKQFEGRGHSICGEPGWEDVATYALDWLQNLPQTDPTR